MGGMKESNNAQKQKPAADQPQLPPEQLRRGFGGMGIAGNCCMIKYLI
jgi:hypothetical protein